MTEINPKLSEFIKAVISDPISRYVILFFLLLILVLASFLFSHFLLSNDVLGIKIFPTNLFESFEIVVTYSDLVASSFFVILLSLSVAFIICLVISYIIYFFLSFLAGRFTYSDSEPFGIIHPGPVWLTGLNSVLGGIALNFAYDFKWEIGFLFVINLQLFVISLYDLLKFWFFETDKINPRKILMNLCLFLISGPLALFFLSDCIVASGFQSKKIISSICSDLKVVSVEINERESNEMPNRIGWLIKNNEEGVNLITMDESGLYGNIWLNKKNILSMSTIPKHWLYSEKSIAFTRCSHL